MHKYLSKFSALDEYQRKAMQRYVQERAKQAATTYYHGSPDANIEKLRPDSYVTPDKRIAEIMGRFHEDTGKPWSDDDLDQPYNFGPEIHFKPDREPTGKPTVYAVVTDPANLDLLDNPYEHKTKLELAVQKAAAQIQTQIQKSADLNPEVQLQAHASDEKQAGSRWRSAAGLLALLKKTPSISQNAVGNPAHRLTQLARVKQQMLGGGSLDALSPQYVLPGLGTQLRSLRWRDATALNNTTLQNFNLGIGPRRLYRAHTPTNNVKNWADSADFGKTLPDAAHATLDPVVAGVVSGADVGGVKLLKTFRPQTDQRYFPDFGLESVRDGYTVQHWTPAAAAKLRHGVRPAEIFETAVTPRHRALMPALMQPKPILKPGSNEVNWGGEIAHPPTSAAWRNIIRQMGEMLMPVKKAELLPEVQLQEHQQRVQDRIVEDSPRMLVYHGLGSGKSLSALAAAEAAQKIHGGNYGVVVPASLKGNFEKEIGKFTTGSNPEILSYTGLGMGKNFQDPPETLIMDEAHRLRNPGAASARAAAQAAARAQRLLLLTGSPITNSPTDMANLLSLLNNKQITPEEFERKFIGYKTVRPGILNWLRGITPGEKPVVKNEKELRQLLSGKIDYQPSKTPEGVNVNEETVRVPLSPAQDKIQKAIRTKIPPGFLWKLDQEFPLSRDELAKLNSFMTGLRQVSLSTQPFRADKDPVKAFEQSAKLQEAFKRLQKELNSDPRKKAIIYSNFVDSGLGPYAAGLEQAKIPHAFFHGGVSPKARQAAVDAYNAGKLKALLIGPAGAEGLSTKGTSLIQLLDPHWHESRSQQAKGRGLRFDSHRDLPDELKNVAVQRYLSASKDPSFIGKLLGYKRERTGDEVLERLTADKEQLNEEFRKLLKEEGLRAKQEQEEKQGAELPEFNPDYTPGQLHRMGVYKSLYEKDGPRLASLGEWKPDSISILTNMARKMAAATPVTSDTGANAISRLIARAELMGSRGRARMYGRPEPEDRDHDYVIFTDDAKEHGELNKQLRALTQYGFALKPRPDGFLTASKPEMDISYYPTAKKQDIHKAWALQEAGMSKDDAWAKIDSEKLAYQDALAAQFTPDYTPEQMENLGVYDALYRGQGPRLASLGAWKPEWISEHDPKGWLEWYQNYNAGRRIPDEDMRQIKRWANFKSRHGGPFITNPTARRGWALRNWAINPEKLVPERAEEVRTMLQDYQAQELKKYLKRRFRQPEKQAELVPAVIKSYIAEAATAGPAFTDSKAVVKYPDGKEAALEQPHVIRSILD